MPKGIPSATVSRLVTYLRVLDQLNKAGELRTSSEHLAAEARVSAFQVRKDLAYFGSFGTRGSGYEVDGLLKEIRRILGLDRRWNVVIVGMGRLGQALADYPQYRDYDFSLVAGFDVDHAKVGRKSGAIDVHHLDDLPRVAAEAGVDMAFLTVPAPAAQAAADAIVAAGIEGVLNFVPAVINVPDRVKVETADFLVGMKRLAYFLKGT